MIAILSPDGARHTSRRLLRLLLRRRRRPFWGARSRRANAGRSRAAGAERAASSDDAVLYYCRSTYPAQGRAARTFKSPLLRSLI